MGMLDGYRADDRLDDEEDDDVGQPTTYTALAVMWAERDARYAASSRALTEVQIESIRSGRMSEVSFLPPKQRGPAAMAVLRWYPPMHGQGGAS